LRGDHDIARAMYTETEAVFRSLEDKVSAAWARNHQGDIERDLGQRDQAASHYQAALATFRALADSWGIASSLVDLGNLARRNARFVEAHSAYAEAIERFGRVGHTRGIARVLESMSLLASVEARHERALTLAGAASRIRELLGTPLLPADQQEIDRALENAHTALDSEGARQPYQCGRCMGIAEAVGYAMSDAG
jgi:tetratricopeptide (TPR) repeat protein